MASNFPDASHSIRRAATDPQQSQAMAMLKQYASGSDSSYSEYRSQLHQAVSGSQMRAEYVERLQRMFKPSAYSDSESLVKHLDALRAAQQKFFESLPSDQQRYLKGQPFTRERVIKLVEETIADWENNRYSGKFGHVKKYFHKIGGTLNAHSKPLQMLPGNSEYVSVFYGALITVIHASANHQRISASIPQAIAEINDAVLEVDQRTWLYPTAQIKILVQQMYTEIFQFLIVVMKWYSSSRHRTFGAFNEGLLDDHKGLLARILYTAGRIKSEAESGLSAEVRNLTLTVEDLNQQHEMSASSMNLFVMELNAIRKLCDRMCESQRRVEAKLREEQSAHKPEIMDRLRNSLGSWEFDSDTMAEQEMIGAPATRLLMDNAEADLDESDMSLEDIDSNQSGNLAAKASSSLSEVKPEFDRSTVVQWSNCLENLFHHDQIYPELASDAVFFVERRALTALDDWLERTDSTSLYIWYRSSRRIFESASQLLALRLVETLQIQGVPTISYFCNDSTDISIDHTSIEESSLMSMIYALIWQLARILPPQLEQDEQSLFDVDRFRFLSNDVSSFDAAISLLEDLLAHTKLPLLFLVIDGVLLVEDFSEDPQEVSTQQQRVQKFVDTLLHHQSKCNDQDPAGETFKILFTTTGMSTALMETLDEDCITCIQPKPGGRRPGRPLAGRQAFSSLRNL